MMGRFISLPGNRFFRCALRLSLGFLLAVSLGGCVAMDYTAGFLDRLFGDAPELTPPELMMEGDEQMAEGRYDSAAEAFQQVKDRYPYSPYAIRAELKMADALFKRGDYNTAFEAYDEFERLHPRDANIPYVIFQKGDCHLEQVSAIDRDQTHTTSAREEFERLIKRFPNHNLAKVARTKIRKCLIYLSEYELYVGHFYFRNEQYKAAMGRYKYIIENYPDTGQYHEAMEYIRICRDMLQEQQAAEAEEVEETAEAPPEEAKEETASD